MGNHCWSCYWEWKLWNFWKRESQELPKYEKEFSTVECEKCEDGSNDYECP